MTTEQMLRAQIDSVTAHYKGELERLQAENAALRALMTAPGNAPKELHYAAMWHADAALRCESKAVVMLEVAQARGEDVGPLLSAFRGSLADLLARVPAAGTLAVPRELVKDVADCVLQGHSSRYLANALQAILDAAAVDGGGE